MCFGGSDSSIRALQQQEQERAALIDQGVGRINAAFGGFTPQFYQGVQQNTLASLMPQLMQQYRQAQQQLGTGMAQRGLLQSSAARNARTAMDQQLGLNQIAVGNQAIQSGQDVQKQVATEKANLVNQLQVASNPSLAAQRAVESASSISLPSMVAPLGNMFQDWSRNYLAGSMTQAYQNPSAKPSILGAMGFAPLGKNYNVGG